MTKKKQQKKSVKNVSIKDKTFDISRFKSEMTKELFETIQNSSSVEVFNSQHESYEKLHAKYITEIFNSTILSLINQICSTSKTLPDDLRNNYPIHSLLIKIAKELMLDQLELVYLSIYFDTFGWKNANLDIFDNFIVTALSVKKYLNENTDEIENYLNKFYPDIGSKFSIWIKAQSDFKNGIMITPRKVHERFVLLNKTYNTYCKNNYIDYNESVDKILQMSLPYNEGGRQTNVIIADSNEQEEKTEKKKKGKAKPKQNFIIVEKRKDSPANSINNNTLNIDFIPNVNNNNNLFHVRNEETKTNFETSMNYYEDDSTNKNKLFHTNFIIK